MVRMRKGSGRLSLGSVVAFFVFAFFFFYFFFSFFRFVFGLFFSVGFPVGREGLGAGREEGGGRRKKKGAEKGGGEGRIRWRDGLVLDAFGLFLFLLVWKDQERVSPLFSGSFRIFFG